jgi:hypothetical protein
LFRCLAFSFFSFRARRRRARADGGGERGAMKRGRFMTRSS